MILKLLDVNTYYGESHVLNGVSLEVNEGSIVALLGRNGMGKTTTIRSIMGFYPPRSGSIKFKGQEITNLPSYKIAQLGIALVPQGRRIFPSLSVKENLLIAARNTAKSNAWSLERIYSLFPILKTRNKMKGTLLSGGEQQMLAISRALMSNPDLILMDEPSEGLAPLVVRDVGDIILELNKNGVSILLVEQNLPLVLRTASYAYILAKGQVENECSIEHLRSNPGFQKECLGVTQTLN